MEIMLFCFNFLSHEQLCRTPLCVRQPTVDTGAAEVYEIVHVPSLSQPHLYLKLQQAG